MARFNDVDLFLAVAYAGSFRRAAESLKVTRSTVSRGVSRLEEHLGVALFLRDTSHVRLTDAGVAYAGWAKRAASALAEGELAAKGVSCELGGRLRIAGPPALGVSHLGAIVAKFRQAHPDVVVEMVLSDKVVHPLRDEVDIAVRTGIRLQDSDLKSRKLAQGPLIAVSTPEWAERIDGGDSLPSIPWVVFSRADGSPRHDYGEAPSGLSVGLRVTDYTTLCSAVKAGAGVGVVSHLLVQSELRSGELVQVFPRWKLPLGRLWAVYPSRGRPSRKVRLMLSALVEAFSD